MSLRWRVERDYRFFAVSVVWPSTGDDERDQRIHQALKKCAARSVRVIPPSSLAPLGGVMRMAGPVLATTPRGIHHTTWYSVQHRQRGILDIRPAMTLMNSLVYAIGGDYKDSFPQVGYIRKIKIMPLETEVVLDMKSDRTTQPILRWTQKIRLGDC